MAREMLGISGERRVMEPWEALIQPGNVLVGKYRVERVLGRGGMGVVVAARHIALDELFAVKFLLPEALSAPEAIDRFVREARASARLKGEHVAKVHDVGTLENGLPYMVMEYLTGKDLREHLLERGKLSVEAAMDIVLQACEALEEAHSIGIVHRDLKPQNLFLTRRPSGADFVKVLDFGIAKEISAASADLTKSGAVLGTPLYMSPEQMMRSKGVDARTDIWALGVVLYELCTGEVPFSGQTLTEIIGRVLTHEPKPLRRDAEVPLALESVILRCLRKKPEERYSSLVAFASALRSVSRSRKSPDPLPSRVFELDLAEGVAEKAGDSRRARELAHAVTAVAPESKPVEATGGVGTEFVLDTSAMPSFELADITPASGPRSSRDRVRGPESAPSRRLAQVNTDLVALTDERESISRAPWGTTTKLVAALFAGILALGLIAWRLAPRPSKEPLEQAMQAIPSTSTSARSPLEDPARLQQACEATRKVMLQGGSWGAMPLEGWVVELWLGRRGAAPLSADPSLHGFVRKDSIAPGIDDALAAVPDGTAVIEESSGSSAVAPSAGINEARVVLGGGYARAFFDLAARPRFVALGERIARDTGADHAALYARCAHLSTHDVGAWAWGRDAGAAAATLVVELGLLSSASLVEHAKPGSLGDLARLSAAGLTLDEAALSALVHEGGGRVTTTNGVSVTFPFSDPTRAAVASRAIATKLGALHQP